MRSLASQIVQFWLFANQHSHHINLISNWVNNYLIFCPVVIGPYTWVLADMCNSPYLICQESVIKWLLLVFINHIWLCQLSVADPGIFISGGPLTDLRGGPLQSRFSDSLNKQPFFFPKRGGLGPLGPPPKSASDFLFIHTYFRLFVSHFIM